MPRCIYSLTEFESADREHILQNFLGARWTSNTIVCNELQADFSNTIDSALEEGLRMIRNVFGTRGGRRGPAPALRNIRASSGELFDFEPGLNPRLREPIVRITEHPDGRRDVELLLGDVEQLDWALSMLQREVPGLAVDRVDKNALRNNAHTVGLSRTSVQVDACFGGQDYFRGMLKSCFNLLAANYPAVAYEPCFNAVRDFISAGMGSSQQFVRWTTTPNRLDVPKLGSSDQAIFIVSRGSSVEGVAQFFGDIVHPFQLTDGYAGAAIHCGYVVDPFREAQPAETREPEFAEGSVPIYADQSPEITPAVFDAFKERTSRIFREFRYKRAYGRIIRETVQEVLGPHADQPFTRELADQLAARLAERFARRDDFSSPELDASGNSD